MKPVVRVISVRASAGDGKGGRMKKDKKAAHELNLKGEVCPYTFIKSKLKIEEIEAGEVLKIVIDYEPSAVNVPRSLEHEGHRVIRVEKISAGEWEILVEKS